MGSPLPDVVTAIEEYRSANRTSYPRAHNWLSDIGHECERFLAYARVNWKDRPKPDSKLLGIFEDGNVHEKAVMRSLEDAGFTIQEQQLRFFDDDTLLSGKCDGRLVDPDSGRSFLIEIKSMSPYTWAKTTHYLDMVESRYPWIRHYPAQMQMYLHMDKSDLGLFLLKNKATAELKQIWVPYDAEFAGRMIVKARKVNEAVDSGDLPDRIEPYKGYCQSCDFKTICLPDVDFGEGALLLNDDDLLSMLRKREELLEGASEYQRLDKMVKASLKGKAHVLIGEFVAQSKQIVRKSYTVKSGSYWKTEILKRATLTPPPG